MFHLRRAPVLAAAAVVLTGWSHAPGISKQALSPPRGSIAPRDVRISGGSAADRAAVARVLRGFGRSEVRRVVIRGPVTGPHCDGAWLEVSIVPAEGQDQRGWWDAQVLSGSFGRVRGRPVCAISTRSSRSSVALRDGPGMPTYRYAAVPVAELAREIRTAARSADLRLVTIVVHRPARLVPEIVLVARDPTDFEERMHRFERRLFPPDAASRRLLHRRAQPVWEDDLVLGGVERHGRRRGGSRSALDLPLRRPAQLALPQPPRDSRLTLPVSDSAPSGRSGCRRRSRARTAPIRGEAAGPPPRR